MPHLRSSRAAGLLEPLGVLAARLLALELADVELAALAVLLRVLRGQRLRDVLELAAGRLDADHRLHDPAAIISAPPSRKPIITWLRSSVSISLPNRYGPEMPPIAVPTA